MYERDVCYANKMDLWGQHQDKRAKTTYSKVSCKKTSNLIMFMCKFESTMYQKRYVQSTNDFSCKIKKLAIETNLWFEVQASNFYKHNIFKVFQKEIVDYVWSCSIASSVTLQDHKSYFITEQIMDQNGKNKSVFFKTKFI